MTVTTTYDNTLSRVRIAITSAPSTAEYAIVDRSLDGITWTRVRGGDQVPLNSGAGGLDDYEFTANASNTYRVSYVDTGTPITSAGTAVNGNNTSLTPALPAGLIVGDMLYILATIRNTSASPNTPTGWTRLIDNGNMVLFGRVWQSGVTAPLITFSGGAAGDDTQAVCWLARNVDLVPHTSLTGSNPSAQDIAYSGLTAPVAGEQGAVLAWKQASSTAVSPATYTTYQSSAAGSGASLLVYFITGTVAPGTLTVTGGVAAISKTIHLFWRQADYILRETSAITPAMDRIWLKNTQRPYLNTPVTVTDFSDIERASRTGVFPVVGRSFPVAVTELPGSRQVTLTVTTTTLAAADDFDTRLLSGEPVFLHTPGVDCPIPTMHAVIGDTTQRRTSKRTTRRYVDLPLTEVAPPASIIIGTTVTWSAVISAFATWADLIAAEPSWGDVLDQIADPTDVITP